MLTLSDDELSDGGGELPRGLALHLSCCESCRALADRLRTVSGTLGELADLEPTDEVSERANERVFTALKHGARLTGRVDLPDEDEPITALGRRPAWGRRVALAAAAAVGLMASLLWVRPFAGPAGQVAVEPAPGEARLARSTPGAEDQEEPAPGIANPAEVNAEEQLAEVAPDEEVTASPRPVICRHHSHVDAAMSEDSDCILRAVILPDPIRRAEGQAEVAIDRPPRTVSTTALPEER